MVYTFSNIQFLTGTSGTQFFLICADSQVTYEARLSQFFSVKV